MRSKYFEVSSKNQALSCSKCWEDGVVLHLWKLTTTHRKNQVVDEKKFDLLSIPHFVMKTGSYRGVRHGKTDKQREHHQAKVCERKAKSNHFESILERFQKQDKPRISNCNWVHGRNVQTFGPNSKGRPVLHGH